MVPSSDGTDGKGWRETGSCWEVMPKPPVPALLPPWYWSTAFFLCVEQVVFVVFYSNSELSAFALELGWEEVYGTTSNIQIMDMPFFRFRWGRLLFLLNEVVWGICSVCPG